MVFLFVPLIVMQWACNVISVKMLFKIESSEDKDAVLHLVLIFMTFPERPKISPYSSFSSFCLSLLRMEQGILLESGFWLVD